MKKTFIVTVETNIDEATANYLEIDSQIRLGIAIRFEDRFDLHTKVTATEIPNREA